MIYFIRCSNTAKIGYSADPEKRIKELQTGNPQRLKLMATMPGLKESEKALHTLYAEYRIGTSEWFSFTNKNKLFWSIICLQEQNRGNPDKRVPIITDIQSFYYAGAQKYLLLKSYKDVGLKERIKRIRPASG